MANRGKLLGGYSGRRQLLVLSEHPLLVAGVRACIRATRDLTLFDASTAQNAMAFLTKSSTDLLLLDLTPPTSLSVGFARDALNSAPSLPILVVSTHDESFFAERALRAGAKGYVMEQSGCETLVRAIRHVLAGHIYASPNIAEKLLMAYTRKSPAMASPLSTLSEREFEVFQFVGQGKSNGEIARFMHLSAKTVAAHRNHIRTKLALRSPAELVRFAINFQEGHSVVQRS